MNWIALLALIAVFLFTCYLVKFYAHKNTNWYVITFVFIGWFLAFSVIILIPVDVHASISENLSSDERDIASITWHIVYWIVFCLCWVILPVIQEYEMAGEFRFKSRLKTAIWRHVRILLLLGAIGLVGVIYLLITGKMTITFLPAFGMALSNCWGLFLIILLLGYGLVAIPRTLWYRGDCHKMLYYMQFKMSSLEERLIDLRFQLEDIVKLVHAASLQLPSDSHLHPYLEIVISKCPREMLETHRTAYSTVSADTVKELGEITEQRLADIHREVKDYAGEYHRSQCCWEMLLDQSIAQ